MLKDRYEISLWEDIHVDGPPARYEEKKIAIIGSDSMTAPFRAREPKFVQNINGSNTLSFKVFYTYIDPETGAREDNPFLKLLVNERRVKCFWKNEWYDLVIKSAQESSDGKSITYTCKDLFINELSKTGFNLEFDTELQNNQGTAQELAEKVLEGSDWKLASTGQDTIQQTNEEALYEVQPTNSFVAYKGTDSSEITITTKDTILLFYSVVEDKKALFQFLKKGEGSRETNSQLITGAECYYIDDVKWSQWTDESLGITYNIAELLGIEVCRLATTAQVSSEYRGERLVRAPLQEFVPLVDRNCYVYKDSDGNKIYKYITTEYTDPTMIMNLVTNSKEFADTKGWIGEGLSWKLYPLFDENTDFTSYNATTYLGLTKDKTVFNTGLQNSSMYIEDGFQPGEHYIFRAKGFMTLGGLSLEDGSITPRICDYAEENGVKVPKADSDYFSLLKTSFFIDRGANEIWYEFELRCCKAISRAKITTTKMGLFITPTSNCWLQEVQFFKKVIGADNTRINPGEMDKQSIAREVSRYFLAEQPSTVQKPEDIEFLSSGEKDDDGNDWFGSGAAPTAQYPVDSNGHFTYEKIRSITGKNSNRFNLLQTIAETFECWVQFKIEHDSTGRVIYDTDDGYRPKKWVCFKKEIGVARGYGFVYGIDLKTISRTINSDQITSKVIVVPNTNEYAENGVCEIAQSDFNLSGENFILNFDYYINQGLLDGEEVNKDLYTTGGDALGYYPNLKQKNRNYYASVEKLTQKKLELTKQQSSLEVYKQYLTSAQEEETSLKSDIARLIGIPAYDATKVNEYLASHSDFTKLESLIVALQNTQSLVKSYQQLSDNLQKSVDALVAAVESEDKYQQDLREELSTLHEAFYKKYSRFIQEGSWTSQNYLDENLYYLDAQSVAYTSSRPQISYDISVLRLSALPEFQGKIFNVGDISSIEDTEFFGYTTVNGIRTPYREKVLISEVTSNFENPEKDSFKVQNYKTQFEDLFQRITATTQSLQYASGEYQRASNIVNSDGTINNETLQASFARNESLVYASQNETILQDSTGLTVINKDDPSNRTKITSGGVFISTDGGLSWKNAIRGDGIATQYLTSGSINTENITILDGVNPSFRWDSLGISAYSKKVDSDGNLIGYYPKQFVRFDQYGVYGLKKDEKDEFDPTALGVSSGLSPEEVIWNNAQFGLTWKGFFLHNEDNSVQISSNEDFIVRDANNKRRVQIGRISRSPEGYIYGIKISNANEEEVLETDDTGKLWLRKELNIGYLVNKRVKIGCLDTQDDVHGHEVINANENFIVYEDGHMKAQSGEFTGTINATGGSIGGLTIDSLVSSIESKKVSIRATSNFFLNSSPESITLTGVWDNGDFPDGATFKWYKNNSAISGATSQTLTIQNEGFVSPSYYKLEVSVGGKTYTSNDTLITKDSLDVDATNYEIVTSNEKVLKFYNDEDSGDFEVEENFTIRARKYGAAVYESLSAEKLKITVVPNGEDVATTSLAAADFVSFGEDGTSAILNLKVIQDYAGTDSGLLSYRNALVGNNSSSIRIALTSNDKVVAIKYVPIEFAQSDDMARLNLYADSIVQSIRNSKLIFDKDGLHIKNGGFTITNQVSEFVLATETSPVEGRVYFQKTDEGFVQVTIESSSNPAELGLYYKADPVDKEQLYFDEVTGTLKISGDLVAVGGTFTGTLLGVDGTFSGELHANSGLIGGFRIEDDRLVSPDGNIVLLGEEGNIIARKILLGEGAEIENFIKLGNAYLRNPEKNSDRYFIDVQDEGGKTFVSLNDSGELRLGSLLFNGATSTISGQNWTITPERATFKNVTAQGGTIENVVFKKNTVQSAGGIMIFKPSYHGEFNAEGQFVADDADDVSLGDVLLGGQIEYQVQAIDGNILTVTPPGVGSEVTSLTKLYGLSDGVLTDQLLIGINSALVGDTQAMDVHLCRSGMTFIAPAQNEDGDVVWPTTPSLFLGNLSALNVEDNPLSGFGLYGENVYLKGTLTTQIQTNTPSYAGINTISGAISTKFTSEGDERIVFWAGSKDAQAINIQEAPFQITDKGNLFAQGGVFKGSILTDTSIQGADIYTARIHGSGDSAEDSSLTIMDTSKGIVFKNEVEDKALFRISADGFLTYTEGFQNEFISFENGVASFFGGTSRMTSFETSVEEKGQMRLSNYSLSRLSIEETEKILSQITFGQNGIKITSQDGEIASFQSNETIIRNRTTLKENVIFGNTSNVYVEHQKVSEGYDIYVYASIALNSAIADLAIVGVAIAE